jgi:hypothetical protein
LTPPSFFDIQTEKGQTMKEKLIKQAYTIFKIASILIAILFGINDLSTKITRNLVIGVILFIFAIGIYLRPAITSFAFAIVMIIIFSWNSYNRILQSNFYRLDEIAVNIFIILSLFGFSRLAKALEKSK